MPTGYTAFIIEEEGATFRQYMLRCARAMGVCIEMRDLPLDAPPPKPSEVDSEVPYHQKRLQKARDQLQKVVAFDIPQCDQAAEASYQTRLADYNRRLAKGIQDKARYQAMLDQAGSWEPPTPDHVNFKEFMVSQIRESIAHDCGWMDQDSDYSRPPVRETPEDWRADEIEEARRSIEYHEKKLNQAFDLLEEKRAWLTAFWEALPVPAPFDQIAYVTRDEGDTFSAYAADGTFVCKVPEATATRWPEATSNGA